MSYNWETNWFTRENCTCQDKPTKKYTKKKKKKKKKPKGNKGYGKTYHKKK